ncbi:hypothetical protein PENTCL1PPCAC_23279, partial [Pristionchus entomophagus]
GVFCAGMVGQLARLDHRLWKRKAAAGYPFSRASSMHSVISYISADGTECGADRAPLAPRENAKLAPAGAKLAARRSDAAAAASAMPLVVPMTDLNSLPSSLATASLLHPPYSPPLPSTA